MESTESSRNIVSNMRFGDDRNTQFEPCLDEESMLVSIVCTKCNACSGNVYQLPLSPLQRSTLMDRALDTSEPSTDDALTQAVASESNASSVVKVPYEINGIRRGRLEFRVPPVQAGPVCYQPCFRCFHCIIVCLQTYIT
jgi:hypothetical protein